MSYFYDVAYVLKHGDYLNIRQELDESSLEFIGYSERSEIFTASVSSKNSDKPADELLILLYWKDVNHWGTGRTELLAKEFNNTIHDHVIIGEDMCDIECHTGLYSGSLSIKSELIISVPESLDKENITKLFTQGTD